MCDGREGVKMIADVVQGARKRTLHPPEFIPPKVETPVANSVVISPRVPFSTNPERKLWDKGGQGESMRTKQRR